MPEKNRASDAAIAAVAHELAQLINAAPTGEREGLREDAVGIVRDAVDVSRPPATSTNRTPGTFNPFGIAIPLILMGAVLVFLFPPVGLLMFVSAGLVIAWGVGATLLTRR